jgi:hypothetical protein
MVKFKVLIEPSYFLYKEPKTLYIYFDYHFKTVHRITPDPTLFNGDWRGLADAITATGSGYKNYYKFEVR